MKQHKHAELIKAWADGAKIQHQGGDGNWYDSPSYPPQMIWYAETNYRIKPELKPDYTSTRRVFLRRCDDFGHYAEMENNALSGNPNNVKFIFDGETGLLKDAEVIK